MKFEPLPSTVESPGSAAARFTLEQAPFAGQTFTVQLRICGNPVCPCGQLGMMCQPEAAADVPVSFELDLGRREINTEADSSSAGISLGRAFLAEMQEPEWEWIRQRFLNTKRRQMETMDVDALTVNLPPEVLAGEGTMVGYLEIFPWANAFKFTWVGEEWFADDQYCVRPGCGCTETGLAFFRTAPARGTADDPLRRESFLFHDYVTGKTNFVEAQPGSPAPDALVRALHAAHPDLAATLRRRHGHLLQLGRRLMPKSLHASSFPPSPVLTPRPARPGRNDPCSCGSGKKFKKCCGR